MTERVDVLIVGGGQAGLAASFYLSRAKVPHLVLDGGQRVGDAWRQRWDSLELFSDAAYSALPGLPFPGDPEHFPAKDEVAGYVETYARTFDLPVRLDTRVRSLEPSEGGYRIETESGVYESDVVIVATGAYQQPRVPAFAAKLAADVVQLHSSAYRNAQQFTAASILVVGAANSGAQIAGDLASSRRVRLSRGSKIGRLPRRLLGHGLHWWGDHLGLIAAPLDSLRGRTQRADLIIGTSLGQLERRHGVELVARTIDADQRTVKLADGRGLEVEAIVWSTGFRSDYSWINAPIFDTRGTAIHTRGVTAARGLYLLGMHNQYSRGSSLIGFVWHDAQFITDHISQESVASRRTRTTHE